MFVDFMIESCVRALFLAYRRRSCIADGRDARNLAARDRAGRSQRREGVPRNKMFTRGECDYDSLHRAAPLLLLALQLLQFLARPGHVSSSLIRERRGPVHVISLARDERS